jgi:hypothetical protein
MSTEATLGRITERVKYCLTLFCNRVNQELESAIHYAKSGSGPMTGKDSQP